MTTFHRFQLFSIIFLIKYSILIKLFQFCECLNFEVWSIHYGRNEMIPCNGKITLKKTISLHVFERFEHGEADSRICNRLTFHRGIENQYRALKTISKVID